MIEAFDVPAAKRVQIDLFMDQLAALKYRPWKKTCFVTAPAEHINLPDNSVDLLIGLNSLDHGGWAVLISRSASMARTNFAWSLVIDRENRVAGRPLSLRDCPCGQGGLR